MPNDDESTRDEPPAPPPSARRGPPGTRPPSNPPSKRRPGARRCWTSRAAAVSSLAWRDARPDVPSSPPTVMDGSPLGAPLGRRPEQAAARQDARALRREPQPVAHAALPHLRRHGRGARPQRARPERRARERLGRGHVPAPHVARLLSRGSTAAGSSRAFFGAPTRRPRAWCVVRGTCDGTCEKALRPPAAPRGIVRHVTHVTAGRRQAPVRVDVPTSTRRMCPRRHAAPASPHAPADRSRREYGDGDDDGDDDDGDRSCRAAGSGGRETERGPPPPHTAHTRAASVFGSRVGSASGVEKEFSCFNAIAGGGESISARGAGRDFPGFIPRAGGGGIDFFCVRGVLCFAR